MDANRDFYFIFHYLSFILEKSLSSMKSINFLKFVLSKLSVIENRNCLMCNLVFVGSFVASISFLFYFFFLHVCKPVIPISI